MKKQKEHKNVDMHTAIPVLGNFNYPAILFSLNNVLDDFSLTTSQILHLNSCSIMRFPTAN